MLWKARALDRYCDAEVTTAKAALWKASKKNIGYGAPARQGEHKTKADIDDIDNALKKLKAGNAKPVMMATSKMVARTPNFCGIAEDSNVNDVALKVKNMESALDAFMKQNGNQMKALNDAVNVLSKKDAPANEQISRVMRKEEALGSPAKRKRVEQENALNVEVGRKNMYANVAARNTGPNQPPGNTGHNQPSGTGHVPGIRPMTPRGRKASTIMYGNAKVGNDDKEEILGADVDLCLVGVSKDATNDQLADFIKGKGITVLEIECLSHKDARTNTFRVKIKAAEYDKAMKPEVWPYRVGVRHYKPKRRTQPSWNDQSAQAGGSIQSQHGSYHNQQQERRYQQEWYQQGRYQQDRRQLRGEAPPAPAQPFQLPLNNRYEVDGFQSDYRN